MVAKGPLSQPIPCTQDLEDTLGRGQHCALGAVLPEAHADASRVETGNGPPRPGKGHPGKGAGPWGDTPSSHPERPSNFLLAEGQRKVWPWPQFHLSLSVIEPNSQVP